MATASWFPRSNGVLTLALTLGCGNSELVDTDTEGDEDCPGLTWTDAGDGIRSLEVTSAMEAEELPRYTVIDGNLRIRDVDGLTDLSFLECLTEIRGGLVISGNADLVSLAGLEQLASVVSPWPEYDHVVIRENSKLQDVEGLTAVEEVGNLSIEDNPALTSLDGLASFRRANVISITGNDTLETLGLRMLESVDELAIGATQCPTWDPETEPAPSPIPTGNSALLEIDGLDSLVEYGQLRITGNMSLNSLASLSEQLQQASGLRVDIELNEMLPYEQIELANLPGTTESCGNLGDPQPCECELIPGNP